jgi:hypothetical protein
MQRGLTWFSSNDNASGLARTIGMAAIIALESLDPETGARLTGATYRIVREKGVMLAPVAVLGLPDPIATAAEKLGTDRADQLMAEGADQPLEEVIASILAQPAESLGSAPGPAEPSEPAVTA